MDEIITKIESGKYKSEEMVRICKELGKSEAKAFNEESQQYSGEYQSVRTGDDIDLSRANIATLFFAWLVWDWLECAQQWQQKTLQLLLEHMYYATNHWFLEKMFF